LVEGDTTETRCLSLPIREVKSPEREEGCRTRSCRAQSSRCLDWIGGADNLLGIVRFRDLCCCNRPPITSSALRGLGA
jgi:hypothetical protein